MVLVARGDLKARRGRYVLAALAIVAGTALLVALSTVTFGLKVYVEGQIRELYPADIMLYSDRIEIPVEVVEEIRAMEGVAAVEPLILVGASVEGRGATLVGIPLDDVDYFAISLVEGRLPRKGGEAIVEESLGDLYGGRATVELTESLLGPARRIEVEVVGVLESLLKGFVQAFQVNLIVVPLGWLQGELGAEGFVNAVLITATDKSYVEPIADALKEAFPSAQVYTQRSLIRAAIRIVDLLGVFFNVIIAVTLAISGIVVFTVMTITARERAREVALLKAIGVPGRDIALSALLEVLAISLVGGLAGMGAGYYGAHMLKALLGYMGVRFDLPILAVPGVFVGGVATALAVAVASSTVPIMRLSRLRPLEILARGQ